MACFVEMFRGLVPAPARLRVSALCLMSFAALGLAGCGDDGPGVDEARSPTVQEEPAAWRVAARVNGEPILIEDVDREMVRLQMEGLGQTSRRSALRALVERAVLRQKAEAAGLQAKDDTAWLIRRAQDRLLAEAYAATRIGTGVTVTGSEARAHVAENPDLYSDRAHVALDTVFMDMDAVSRDLRAALDRAETLGAVVKLAREAGVRHRRQPFAAMSETLPAAIRSRLKGLADSGAVFFVRRGDNLQALQVLSHEPRPLEGGAAVDAAVTLLRRQRVQDRLAEVRKTAAEQASVSYFREFSSLGKGDDGAGDGGVGDGGAQEGGKDNAGSGAKAADAPDASDRP
ncbi:hypothetical protein [Yunchengibacter salinarum]|uniref:hypothetical protein n=1 Tax=Yunchengibacter salinarum TaxID=3133399 RepID=UPI0035B6A2E5